MRITRRVPAAVAAAIAIVALFAACGGSSSAPASAAPTVGSSSAANPSAANPSAANPSAANPNAPEPNAAGDIPDNQVFVPYTAGDGSFVVSVPEGWSRRSDGTAVMFTDKFNSVRIDTVARASAPDVGSARATDVQRVSSAPGFQLDDVQTVQRAAGPAILINYEADSAPDSVTGKTVTEAVQSYEFWRAGKLVVLTLSGPKGADNVDPWRKVTDSLRWLA